MSLKKVPFVLTTVFLVLLCLIGILMLTLLQPIFYPLFHRAIVYETQLVNGSEVYQQWAKPTIPIYIEFYLFNLTNPASFLSGGKPVVNQIGPYTYREQRSKVDIVENNTAGTLSYREIKQHFFEPTMSTGTESDVVTTVNLVYLSVARKIDWLPAPILRIIEELEAKSGDMVITSRNVSELLWGYEDPFLRFFPPFSHTFGLFVGRNNSLGGTVVIDTGKENEVHVGQIISVDGRSSLSCWTTKEANQINGSDGSLFHPFLKPNETVYVFASDLCRSFEFKPHEEDTFLGVPVVRYLPSEDSFDSPANSSKNRGFCLHPPKCYKDGVLDGSTCIPDSPIVFSMPHLVHADPSYTDAVLGLHPSAEFNTTFLVEQSTGAVLSVSKKIQINAVVEKNSKLKGLRSVSNVLLPVMFLNESAQADEQIARSLRLLLSLPLVYTTVGALLLVVPAFAIIALVSIYVRRERQLDLEPSPTQPLLSEPIVA
ncbi:unnamed protein product [Calicophoron daubneyi]|uniref:Scavenger receptor class B member 1 n=1 Tax=Calicophoron daubneyi TaxID=300641 RepID=A0AAV2TLR6_CALDB